MEIYSSSFKILFSLLEVFEIYFIKKKTCLFYNIFNNHQKKKNDTFSRTFLNDDKTEKKHMTSARY